MKNEDGSHVISIWPVNPNEITTWQPNSPNHFFSYLIFGLRVFYACWLDKVKCDVKWRQAKWAIERFSRHLICCDHILLSQKHLSPLDFWCHKNDKVIDKVSHTSVSCDAFLAFKNAYIISCDVFKNTLKKKKKPKTKNCILF